MPYNENNLTSEYSIGSQEVLSLNMERDFSIKTCDFKYNNTSLKVNWTREACEVLNDNFNKMSILNNRDYSKDFFSELLGIPKRYFNPLPPIRLVQEEMDV